MEAHGVLGYLTENAQNDANINNSLQNCCGHFRFQTYLPLKFGKKPENGKKNQWDSNLQPSG